MTGQSTDMFEGNLTQASYIVIGVIMTTVSIISYVGNGLIIFLFIKNRLFREANINLFILNMAIANMIESLIGFPFAVVSNFSGRWSFGEVGCIFYAFVCYTCVLAIMMTFVAVSLYRYCAVCKPRTRKYSYAIHQGVSMMLTPRLIPRLLVGIWVYAIAWGLMPFFTFGSYGMEPFKTTCSLAWTDQKLPSVVYIILVAIFVFIIPTTIMIAAYTAILCRTYSQVSSGNASNPSPHLAVNHAAHGVNLITNIESRTTMIVVTSNAMYLLAWTPYAIMSFISATGYQIPLEITPIPTIFTKSQCAFNPLIYFIAHKRFRSSLMELLGFSVSSTRGESAQALQTRDAGNNSSPQTNTSDVLPNVA